ncbi:MAG: XRE family transcriptional regulator [Marinilabiliaceae bacterium]|nr:XRE family transcriptional regulator [Marinilabiliaceae bacterium]
MNIHIGQEIEACLHKQERSVAWLARQLNCDRTNIYKIFKKESIDTLLLQRISKVLNYDFFALYSDNVDDISATQV